MVRLSPVICKTLKDVWYEIGDWSQDHIVLVALTIDLSSRKLPVPLLNEPKEPVLGKMHSKYSDHNLLNGGGVGVKMGSPSHCRLPPAHPNTLRTLPTCLLIYLALPPAGQGELSLRWVSHVELSCSNLVAVSQQRQLGDGSLLLSLFGKLWRGNDQNWPKYETSESSGVFDNWSTKVRPNRRPLNWKYFFIYKTREQMVCLSDEDMMGISKCTIDGSAEAVKLFGTVTHVVISEFPF